MHTAPNPVAFTENRLILALVDLVEELDLDTRDFVIFGSAPLLAHGLRDHIEDLDVVARGSAWKRVVQCGKPATGSINGAPLAKFSDSDNRLILFSNGWITNDWDIDELIDEAEVIEGLRFARLTDVLRFKQALGRPKDHADVDAILRLLGGPGNPKPST